MLRRFTSLGLFIFIAAGLAACGGGGSSSPTTSTNTPSTSASSASAVLGGATNPASTIGQNGDYYLNATTGRLFGPKVNNAWPAASLQLSGTNGTVTLPTSTGSGVITGSGSTVVVGSLGSTGLTGAAGFNSAVTTTAATITECTSGGTKVTTGLDTDRSGTLNGAEISASTSTSYLVCNGAQGTASTVPGGAGATGFNSAVTTTAATITECTSGGTKVTTGLDTDRSGTLNGAEISASTSTSYLVCNGAVGAAGNTILNGTNPPQPSDGIVGDFFVDTLLNKIYGPKKSTGWGTPYSVVGIDGKNGSSLLTCNGARDNVIGGLNDYCIDTSGGGAVLYGPKVANPSGAIPPTVWPTGFINLAGTPGKAGTTIHTGSGVPSLTVTFIAGAPVNIGDFYLDTNTGTLWGGKTTSTWGASTILRGITGTVILSGTATIPIDPSLGSLGDFYLNTATYTLYGPKDASGWPTVGLVLKGTDGKAGTTIHNGTTPPTTTTAALKGAIPGDFYIDTKNQQLWGPLGPAPSFSWGTTSTSLKGDNGLAGTTIWSGTSPPGATGTVGDFYIDTATRILYGPKTASLTAPWAATTTLSGLDGKPGSKIYSGTATISLTNPSGALDGDYYLQTTGTTTFIFGPKTGATWGGGVSLVGPQGIQGPQGVTGTLIISGPNDPTTTLTMGAREGDYYLNTTTHTLFGPRAAGSPYWLPTGLSLNGSPGTNGNTIYNGTTNPTGSWTATGVIGDFYLNTAATTLFGPKTSTTAWPSIGVSLVGPIAPADVLVTSCSAIGNTNINITASPTVRFIFCDYGGTASAGTITLTLQSALLYSAGTVITVTTTNTGGALGGGPLTLRLISPGSTLTSSTGANLALPANISDFGVFGIYPEPRSFSLVSSGSTNRWFLL
jgi:hypothetical protein